MTAEAVEVTRHRIGRGQEPPGQAAGGHPDGASSDREEPQWTGLLRAERGILRRASALPWALMAAAGTALWIPLKMLRVAHGDTTTALATLEASSKATVVTGMLVLLLPTVVLVAWAACLMSWASELGRIAGAARDEHAAARDTAKRALLRLLALTVPAALLAWVTAAVVGWPAAVAAAALVALISFALYRRARRPVQHDDLELPRWLDGHPVRIAVTAAAAVAGLTLAVADIALSGPLNDDVWLPPLAVTTVEGATTVYVLRDDGDRRTVLRHSPREVTVLQDTDVTDERLCALRPGADGRSLWDLANGAAESRAPSCPR